MFLFGLVLLLIESKLVTAMNLLWGGTWVMSAVVFGSIIATLLPATLLGDRCTILWGNAGVGLVITLLTVYTLPLQTLIRGDASLRLFLRFFYVGIPICFAGLCFVDRFRFRVSADVAFGWNLLGAAYGGLLEFLSMSLGFRSLMLVAVVAYLGAFLLTSREGEPFSRQVRTVA